VPVSRSALGLEIGLQSSLLITCCFTLLCSNQRGNVARTITGIGYFLVVLLAKQKNLLRSLRSSCPHLEMLCRVDGLLWAWSVSAVWLMPWASLGGCPSNYCYAASHQVILEMLP